jgi:RimJ/RimL family protein N-acetyltransferase
MPYRILTPRLLLRPWNPVDAPALAEAVTESLPSLLEWMPWAKHEPMTLPEREALLRRFRGQFDLDQEYIYGIFDRASGAALGGTGLHPRRGPGAFEIGYWMRTSRTGRGLTTEAAGALTRVAFEVCRVDRVEIRCAVGNDASAAIPLKLGYPLEATLRRRIEGVEAGALHDVRVFTLFAADYPTCAAASAQIEVFDAVDRSLL